MLDLNIVSRFTSCTCREDTSYRGISRESQIINSRAIDIIDVHIGKIGERKSRYFFFFFYEHSLRRRLASARDRRYIYVPLAFFYDIARHSRPLVCPRTSVAKGEGGRRDKRRAPFLPAHSAVCISLFRSDRITARLYGHKLPETTVGGCAREERFPDVAVGYARGLTPARRAHKMRTSILRLAGVYRILTYREPTGRFVYFETTKSLCVDSVSPVSP